MKVKNYIIENYQIFMDQLEKELCQNNISYVRMDNEIHFLDKIIRFYESNIEIMYAWAYYFNFENSEEISFVASFDTLNTIFCKKDKVQYKPKDDSERIDLNILTKNYQSRNKNIKKTRI